MRTTLFRQAAICLLLLALCASNTYAQKTIPENHFIPWASNGLYTRLEPSGNYAYTCFQVMDDGESAAFLSTNTNEILVYNLQRTDRPIQRIDLPDYMEEMTYADGKFYVTSSSSVYVINRESEEVEDIWAIQRPEGASFVVSQIRKVGDQVLLLTADERSHLVSARGISMLDEHQWYLSPTLQGRTEKFDADRFRLEVNISGKQISREIKTARLGLPDHLGTVTLAGSSGKAVCLDVEMSSDAPGADVRRFLVFLSAKGKLISKTEVPMHYYTYARRDLSFDGSNIYLAISTEQGVYLVRIEPNRDITIPEIRGKRYHYNEHLPAASEPDDSRGSIDVPEAGSNCVTRTQIYENALKFRDLSWTASATNIAASCTLSGSSYYRTPTWVTTGAKTSVPYKWGGWTDWTTFAGLATQGRKCGSYATESTNSPCPQPPYAAESDALVIGDDCSGFVSRCWELTSKLNTSGLPGVSTNLGSATSTTGFGSLKVGDIVNKPKDHTRICLADNPTGSASFIEASAVDWRVNERQYNMTALTGYTALRFTNVNDVRLRLNQAISISPSSVNQNCPLTVTYAVKNFGTESWTGEAQLWIIQSTGTEVLLKANTVTLNANAASAAYTFSTSSVSSPTGLTKLEVRLKNSSTCNYSRPYKAGNGSYVNPVSFTIGSTCSGNAPANDNCASATYLPVGTSCNNTIGNNTGATASSPAPVGGCPSSGLKDIWFHFYMPNVTNPVVTIRSTAGTMTDGVMEVYQGSSCSNLSYITCEDDNTNGNGSMMPVIGLQGGPNNHIWIRFWGYSGTTGTFNICVFNYSSNNITGGGGQTSTIQLGEEDLKAIERQAAWNATSAVPRFDFRDSVELYPNPAADQVNLSFDQEIGCTEMSYVVYNAEGKMILKQRIAANEPGWRSEQIDVATWRPGLYTLQLSTCSGNYTEKLMIIRN